MFVGKQKLRFELAPVSEDDAYVGPLFDHVIIGDDETEGIDDDARAERVLDALARHTEVAVITEELAEKGVGKEADVPALIDDPLGIDIDDRRGSRPNHGSKGKLDLSLRRRQLLLRRRQRRRRDK